MSPVSRGRKSKKAKKRGPTPPPDWVTWLSERADLPEHLRGGAARAVTAAFERLAS